MRRRGNITCGLLCAAVLVSGCAGASHGASDATKLAENITRAVYADNLDAVTAPFDNDLQKQVTRSDLGLLSDKMHQLGEIKSITQRSADPDKGRYDYDVTFERGAMIAQMRLDPNGKVGAYRIEPAAPAH